jgi:hypothetical protein
MKGIDWFGLIAIALMLLGAVLISYYIITKEIASCTKDPVKYFVDESVKDNKFYNNYSYVRVEVYYDKNDSIPIKIIEFEM